MPFPDSSFARSGRFSEIYPIGQGAVGRVYSAHDNLGRRVAVKEALPGAEGFAAFRAKFEQEARLQAALDHPNIVRVHHLEQDPHSGELFLICEYADAGSLADRIERDGPLPAAEAVAVAIDICAALEETAARRIVHRDVKPSNILLFRRAGGGLTAKLADFGIAQDARQRKTTMLSGASHPGTPLYMAPEQADVTAILDVRADIFALGLTLWEMLTGEDYKALAHGGAGPSLQAYRPDAGPALGHVIARAVRPNRDERYQTPQAFAADLRRLLAGQPIAPQAAGAAPPAPERRGCLGPVAVITMMLAIMFGGTIVVAAIAGVFGFLLPVRAETFPLETATPILSETSPPLPTPPPAELPPGLPAPTAPPFEPPTASPVPGVSVDGVYLNLSPTDAALLTGGSAELYSTPLPFEPTVTPPPELATATPPPAAP